MKQVPIILALALAALVAIEVSAPGEHHAFPGRSALIAAAGFVGLVVLAKVALPPLLSRREEHDDR